VRGLTSDDAAPAELIGDSPNHRNGPELVSAPMPDEELAARYRAGASLDELAARYRSYPHKVRRILVAAGVKIRPPGPTAARPDQDGRGRGVLAVRWSVEDLVERYRAGASLDDLAIQCECASRKVRRILIAAGVEIRHRSGKATGNKATHDTSQAPPAHGWPLCSDQGGRPTNLRSGPGMGKPLLAEELAEQYQAGASLEYLAILCRCAPAKVRCLLVKAGVKIRPPGCRPTRPGQQRHGGGKRAGVLVPAGELAERYRAGATLIELAALCACSSITLRHILVAAGTEMRPRGRPTVGPKGHSQGEA
jgi:uncharacterized protein (DUF433 family)